MMGGSETGSGDKDVVHAVAIHVPIGWQRRVEHGQVVYVSPSGTALSTLDEVKTYLLTDGTCKCGLECPLVINKVFNFSVGVKAEQQQHSQQLGKAEQDMTKLCNHRRKVVAMAALCRSMQSSQLPFSAHHHSEVNSVLVDSQDPKRMRVEKEEEDHGTYQPRPHVTRARPHNNLNPAPCASPRSSPQLMYHYNGSSPLAHTATNSHHPMDALRRLQYPPPSLSASSSSSSSSSFSTFSSNTPFLGYSAPQRSPRMPTPQNLSQGQRSIPQTPETPGSPRLGPLSPPPPSSPMTLGVGGGRGMQSHTSHPHSVIVGGSPLSPSPSPSPSVNNMNCVSPHQRSRHPSSSSSSLSEQGGVAAGVEGGVVMGSNLAQRRKSTSSSPHSPLPCGSPNPSIHFPKYKLEDILEQFKNSGNSSTNNHHILFPSSPVLLANQSSSNNPHILSLALDKGGNLKPSKAALGPVPNAGPAGFGLNAAGPSGLPLGPFLNHHHSHQTRQPHPSSFPASSLLSAAAKAQLASQSSNPGGNPLTSASPLDVLKDNQQQQPSKVTNSTLHKKHAPSSSATTRPPTHPSLAVASSLLFPPSHPLAQSLATSSHHLPAPVERNASHRKRQRRSPTVLSMLRETQQLVNGPRKTPPGDSITNTIINLSSSSPSLSSYPSPLHSSSTSTATQNHNSALLENHQHPILPGQSPRLSATARQSMPLTGPLRQMEALDFTTGLAGAAGTTALALDPPTQPLSALLHLLSVQNAQQAATSASNAAPGSLGSVSLGGSGGGGNTNRQSPRPQPSSPGSYSNSVRPLQTRSPCRTNNTTLPSTQQPLSPSPTSSSARPRSRRSPLQAQPLKSSPLQRLSPPSTALPSYHLARHNSSSPTPLSPPLTDKHQQTRNQNHITTVDSISQAALHEATSHVSLATDMCSRSRSRSTSLSTTMDLSHSQSCVTMVTSTSPKPLDLSNHVLALLAASSTAPQGEGGSLDRTTGRVSTPPGNNTIGPGQPLAADNQVSIVTEAPQSSSPGAGHTNPSPPGDSPGLNATNTVGDSSSPLPLAEAFPFMNQEQLLQLLSTTGGLPSILDPAVLASLPLGGLWLGGQQGQIPSAPATPQPSQNPSEQQPDQQQQHLLIQQHDAQQHSQDQQHKQPQQMNGHPLFPLLPSLVGTQGELPLNLLGLLNPLPPPVASTPGQEADLGLAEKTSLQALLMASLLLGQQQTAMLPLSGLGQLSQLSLEVPLHHPHQITATLDGLPMDKNSSMLDPSSLTGPSLLEVLQGLLPPPPSEGSLQALQSLLLPTHLQPHPSTAFLPLSPALLTAALGSAELHPSHSTQLAPAQQTQHTPPQVNPDPGVDTLFPLPLQGKDNPILQQLLPALLNPAVLGDLSGLASLHNMVGLGAGPLLLPPVQASALGMSLLQGPDGAINLLNNIQLNIAPPTEDKPMPLQETQSPTPQEDIPASHVVPETVPSPAPAPPSAPPRHPTPLLQRGSASSGGVIDPYTSFMDTIYTSFLQVSAKEQEEGAQSGPTDPTSPFCALPPVSFQAEHPTPLPTLPQASAPISLSPRRACSLRNPDLSRLSLEAAAHSPAQGTPKPSEDESASPSQRKAGMVEGHTHPEPPHPPTYLEEAKTDCAGPAAAACPYVEAGVERPQAGGYHSPRDGGSGRSKEESAGVLLHTEQGRDQAGPTVGARRGRKRKQTLQNVLEDFRDMDAAALEDNKPTAALLKPERSVRGRRRRGARSQRQ